MQGGQDEKTQRKRVSTVGVEPACYRRFQQERSMLAENFQLQMSRASGKIEGQRAWRQGDHPAHVAQLKGEENELLWDCT